MQQALPDERLARSLGMRLDSIVSRSTGEFEHALHLMSCVNL